MMCAVIILFAICWTPVKTKQIIRSYFPHLFNICSMNSFYWVTTITILFHWLAMAHSFVNPIIYSFMSQNFRVSVNHLLPKIKAFNISFKIENKVNLQNNFQNDYKFLQES